MTPKQWRESKKLSQSQAAERLGISQATVSNVENGQRPDWETMEAYRVASKGKVMPNDFLSEAET